jgi:hypothetical protein
MSTYSRVYALLLLAVSTPLLQAAAKQEESSTSIRADLDGDGRDDMASVHMVPHSMRFDVEIVLAKQPTRPINVIAVEQPPTGPLVYAKLRKALPGRYAFACTRIDNRDSAPCEPGLLQSLNAGVEVITPGQSNLLIIVQGTSARTVRLQDPSASKPGSAGPPKQPSCITECIAPASSAQS